MAEALVNRAATAPGSNPKRIPGRSKRLAAIKSTGNWQLVEISGFRQVNLQQCHCKELSFFKAAQRDFIQTRPVCKVQASWPVRVTFMTANGRSIS
jgi:hypothetical protein